MKEPYKELRKSFLDRLSRRLSEFHFQLNASKGQFRAKRDWGSVAIMIGFIPHPGIDFDITGSVGIRIDAVENLVNENHHNPFATEKGKASTFTMGAEFGRIINGKQLRWTIRDDNDVAPVAADFLKTVEAVGLPYIERYSDFNKALEVLSGNEPSNWLHMAIHGKRCQNALALAFVLKDKRKVEALVQQNTAFLKARNDQGLPEFEALARKLNPKHEQC